MQDDLRWQSVFTPGSGSQHFQIENSPAQTLSHGPAFAPYTAWFLSECSRLAYVNDAKLRQQQLDLVATQEIAWCTPKDLAGGIWIKDDQCIVVFRGTNQSKNWLRNINAQPKSWGDYGKVHNGFLKSFEACWRELEPIFQAHCKTNPQTNVFCCGHSLGAAMASIAGLAINASAIYNFGSPRLGDSRFAKQFTDRQHYRCCNIDDMVTHLPPNNALFTYQHIGEAIWLGTKGRKRDRFKQRLKKPELFLTSPKHISDHAPINYSLRLAELVLQNHA